MWRRRGLKPGFERSLKRVRHIPHDEFPRRSRPSSNFVCESPCLSAFPPHGARDGARLKRRCSSRGVFSANKLKEPGTGMTGSISSYI